jgi:hypothetical protein
MTRLLIDECLSAELVLLARERGHHEASHVLWIGKAGWKDWALKNVPLDEDWVPVTWNCRDFRGPKKAPGTKEVLRTFLFMQNSCALKDPPAWIWNCRSIFSWRRLRNWKKTWT